MFSRLPTALFLLSVAVVNFLLLTPYPQDVGCDPPEQVRPGLPTQPGRDLLPTEKVRPGLPTQPGKGCDYLYVQLVDSCVCVWRRVDEPSPALPVFPQTRCQLFLQLGVNPTLLSVTVLYSVDSRPTTIITTTTRDR